MYRILGTLALVAAVACDSPAVIAPVPLTELEAAPLAVSVNGQDVILTPYLWRDFMPVAPEDGRSLIAVLRVGSVDGTALAGPLTIDAAWIVNGDEVWSAPVGERRVAAPIPASIEVVMRGGPRWGPGIMVDAVVRVTDAADEAQLLRATNIPIHRTD